jgi:hypothetical protein
LSPLPLPPPPLLSGVRRMMYHQFWPHRARPNPLNWVVNSWPVQAI